MVEYDGFTKQIKNVMVNNLNLTEEEMITAVQTGSYKEIQFDSENKLAYVLDVSYKDYPGSKEYYVYSWYNENAKWN